MKGLTDVLDARWRDLWYADRPDRLKVPLLMAHLWVVLIGAAVVAVSTQLLWLGLALAGERGAVVAVALLVTIHFVAGFWALMRDSVGRGQRRKRLEEELGDGWRRRYQLAVDLARSRWPWLRLAQLNWDLNAALWVSSGVVAHGFTPLVPLMLLLRPPAWGAFCVFLILAVAGWAVFGVTTVQRLILLGRSKLVRTEEVWELVEHKDEVAGYAVAEPMVPGEDWRWDTLAYVAEPGLARGLAAVRVGAIAMGVLAHWVLFTALRLGSGPLGVAGLVMLAGGVTLQVVCVVRHRKDALRDHGWSHKVAALVRYSRHGDIPSQEALLDAGKWDQMSVLEVSDLRFRQVALLWHKLGAI